MSTSSLQLLEEPSLEGGRMLLGLTGWMDGGDVSTGVIEWLKRSLKSRRFAQIDPEDFYIYNFPGSMELSAMFRPHCRIVQGTVGKLEMPANEFSVSVEENLVLFEGKEPNVRWESFGDCLFELARRVGLNRIYAVGSVAGSVPHTRDPRMSCSVSHEHLREGLVESGMRLGQYEGPASIVTYLTQRAPREEMEMVSLVAEIPVYVDGTNPICIESVTRKVSGVLGLQVDLGELRAWRDMFERRLSEVVKDEDELLEQVRKLESDYDNDIFDTEMSELKEWLRNRGIRTD